MILHLLNGPIRLGKIASLLLFASLSLLHSVYAQGEATTFTFEMESQPLKDAVKVFSDKTGIDVISRGAWLRGELSPALQGEYTGEEALKRLLRNSELRFEYTGSNTIAITDPNLSDGDSEVADTVVELESITVVGTEQARYVVDTTDALTGFDLDFLENPRSITILPEQLILDRKITDLNEALRNVPSVAFGDGFGGTNNDFFLRGFRRSGVYRNGFRRSGGGTVNLTNVAYTQVISGPASITYGQVEPGGAVDVVTKTPLDVPRISGELRLGSFSDFTALVDLSQPLNDNIAVRVVASHQDAESFRDFKETEIDTIAVSSRIRFSENTLLEVAHEYREESSPFDRGSIAVPTPDGYKIVNEIIDIPISRIFGDPFEGYESEVNFSDAVLTHDFNDTWSAKLGLSYQDIVSSDLQSRPLGIIIVNEGEIFNDEGFFNIPILPEEIALTLAGLSRDPTRVYDEPTDRIFVLKRLDGTQNRKSEALFANLQVKGEFFTGELKHRITFGADFEESDGSGEFVVGEQTNGLTNPLFNIENPVYSLPGTFPITGVPTSTTKADNTGFYFNSFTEITNRTGVLLGIRYSETENSTTVPSLNQVVFGQGSNGWIPQLGISHQISDSLSLYASYSESFEPNIAEIDGPNGFETFDPEIGEQIEAGVKAELFDGRLQASAAIYEITKVNVIVGSDENDRPILAEGQSAKGFELSATGQPIPGMNITVAYSYIDAEVEDDGVITRPRSIAENSFNIYASYEWQEGVLNGFGIGGGAFYEGNRFNGNSNIVKFDGYTLVDSSIWYTIKAPKFLRGANEDGTLRFQLAFKNLFDEIYYSGGSGTTTRIPLGTPRTVFGSISWEF